MKIKSLIVTAAMVPMLSGCFANQPDAEPCETNIFNFRSKEEPLGSATDFDEAARTAAQGSAPVTLGEVTRAAGWDDNWDRMFDVFLPTNSEKLYEQTQTNKNQICWKNWPEPLAIDDDHVPGGLYLFFADDKPVQAVSWPFDQKFLSTKHLSELTPQTVLIPDPSGPKLVPAP
ncbi:hypothetical protein ACL02S_10135 [Nocardia sp. 004]|uniref:hypothetical protein n=1 Tax=Nocardia sp. 004 TaxID=3385978 RepID=UPI0039A2E9AC